MTENEQAVEEKTMDEKNEKVISMWQYFIDCISSKYCTFKGRANRKEFWSYTLFYYLITIVLFFILGVIGGFLGNSELFNIMNYAWGAAFLLPNIGIKVRRLHDINFSGWWYGCFYILLFSMVIVASILAVINYANGVSVESFKLAKSVMFILGGVAAIGCGAVLCVMPFIAGTKGKNNYGDAPQEKDFKTSTVLLFILLPIAGIFVLGGISGYSKAMIRYKTNKIIDQVTYITAATKSTFDSPAGYIALYDGNSVEQIFSAAYVSRNPENGSFVNFAGGNIYMKPSGRYSINDNKAFILALDGLSKDICTNLTILSWAEYSQGFIGMHVYNQETADSATTDTVMDNVTVNSVTDINNGIITTKRDNDAFPLLLDEANRLCACDNVNTCAITWKYY